METVTEQMTLSRLVELTKQIRNFNVNSYIENKSKAINRFFKENNLDAAVIGISGGIDSAVAIALLNHAAMKKDSPIKRIEGLIMPIHDSGTSGQHKATENGLKVMSMFKDSKITGHRLFDLTGPQNAYVQSIAPECKDAWAKGQLASIVRTPALYFSAALLQSLGFGSLVVGTTNRDEGAYIGFFGKASDAMVDLQPIADIHKSEVYEVAKALGVPEKIINATPRGDVWDNKVDEEMIGAPYWFLEMYLLLREETNTNIMNDYYSRLSVEEKKLFEKYALAIETIHRKNEHKYKVGNPAHFIDVMPRAIMGGWK